MFACISGPVIKSALQLIPRVPQKHRAEKEPIWAALFVYYVIPILVNYWLVNWFLLSMYILTNQHRARVVGYGPFSLYVILKEGLCPSSGDINRLMTMYILRSAIWLCVVFLLFFTFNYLFLKWGIGIQDISTRRPNFAKMP
jgi:hypothetical protein